MKLSAIRRFEKWGEINYKKARLPYSEGEVQTLIQKTFKKIAGIKELFKQNINEKNKNIIIQEAEKTYDAVYAYKQLQTVSVSKNKTLIEQYSFSNGNSINYSNYDPRRPFSIRFTPGNNQNGYNVIFLDPRGQQHQSFYPANH